VKVQEERGRTVMGWVRWGRWEANERGVSSSRPRRFQRRTLSSFEEEETPLDKYLSIIVGSRGKGRPDIGVTNLSSGEEYYKRKFERKGKI